MDDVLIRAEGVSKKFARSLRRSLWYGVEDTLGDLVGLSGKNVKLRRDEFWAVDDISFEVRRGECLGLIGGNGAGKTTLLKMLNGIIKPDKGRIEMRGRIAALIALGAGFNPILTGRENVYVNGSVLGLSKKEVDAKLDEIIDFAEIEEFIDMPVQSYSSGMQVRLGFAVATALEPDVLLLDEILAVGDIAFQAKCLARISKLRGSDTAVIFVSHNLHQTAVICTKGLFLEHGQKVSEGDLQGVITQYRERSAKDSGVEIERWSGEEVQLQKFEITNQDGGVVSNIQPGETVTLTLTIESIIEQEILVDIRILDSIGTLFQATNETYGECITIKKGRNIAHVSIPGISRHGDELQFNLAIWHKSDKRILCWLRGARLRVRSAGGSSGRDYLALSYRVT